MKKILFIIFLLTSQYSIAIDALLKITRENIEAQSALAEKKQNFNQEYEAMLAELDTLKTLIKSVKEERQNIKEASDLRQAQAKVFFETLAENKEFFEKLEKFLDSKLAELKLALNNNVSFVDIAQDFNAKISDTMQAQDKLNLLHETYLQVLQKDMIILDENSSKSVGGYKLRNNKVNIGERK